MLNWIPGETLWDKFKNAVFGVYLILLGLLLVAFLGGFLLACIGAGFHSDKEVTLGGVLFGVSGATMVVLNIPIGVIELVRWIFSSHPLYPPNLRDDEW